MIKALCGLASDVHRFGPVDCIFADPPDNLGLDYGCVDDNLDPDEYARLMHKWIGVFLATADVVWLSFNARHTPLIGWIVHEKLTLGCYTDWEVMPCVQTFTFGNYRHSDLTNGHRPLWRFVKRPRELYPDAIRVPSARQLQGDKRADPRGRIPSDVFDFPRVTGNSRQRRKWHKTQLHEGLVERCLRMSCKRGDHVLDPFAGTGTTGRVARRLGLDCTLVDANPDYIDLIKNDLEIR
jgi:site-specific DNA-methyltransferase (adenine-specific)